MLLNAKKFSAGKYQKFYSHNFWETSVKENKGCISLHWGTDGDRIVASTRGNVIQTWDINNKNILHEIFGASINSDDDPWSLDGQRLVIRKDGFKIVDPKTGSIVHSLSEGVLKRPHCFMWNPSHHNSLAVSDDNGVTSIHTLTF